MSLRGYIPVDKLHLPERFEFPFGKNIYIIGVNWNESGQYFTVDLFEPNLNPIALGERVVANQELWANLTDPRLPFESVVPMDESNPDTDITFENFGETVKLYIDSLAPSMTGGDNG